MKQCKLKLLADNQISTALRSRCVLVEGAIESYSALAYVMNHVWSRESLPRSRLRFTIFSSLILRVRDVFMYLASEKEEEEIIHDSKSSLRFDLIMSDLPYRPPYRDCRGRVPPQIA